MGKTSREKVSLFLEIPDLRCKLQHDVGGFCATNQLDPFIRFDKTPACDGHVMDKGAQHIPWCMKGTEMN